MTTESKQIQELFSVGAHFGYTRTRRNPSVVPFIFGQKNRNDIFDLEKTVEKLATAEAAVADIAASGKSILFVSGKNEAFRIVRAAAEKVEQPYVCGRWIGGTLTNFKEISKRTKRLDTLRADKEKGNLDKYTKKERLLLDREMEDLEQTFGGIVAMKELPGALFVVDPRHEHIAVQEAHVLNIPIVALSNSDCDISNIAYPIPANDAAQKSVQYVTDAIVRAIEKGAANRKQTAEDKK